MMRAGNDAAAPVTIRFTAGGLWREGAGDKQDLYPGGTQGRGRSLIENSIDWEKVSGPIASATSKWVRF